ncbi:MAG TPA: hypothetical protein VG347_05090 [Verrucomicrobiae bacterium]|nr:hypothetical protein [Verrucomicrobiae bacterium]
MSKSPKLPISPAVRRQIKEAQKARWAKIKAAHPAAQRAAQEVTVLNSHSGTAVEVMKPTNPAFVPKLLGGDDAATAKQLTKLFTEAQNGMRRIVALGLFAWEIKEKKLKHGEWGTWLAAHAPKLCRPDSETGKAKASAALTNFMDLTKGVLESVGIPSLEQYFETLSKFPRGGNLSYGGLLLLPDKKIPEEAKPLREQIFALVDNKTQRQLFMDFKQAEEQADGSVKKKAGRLQGQGGASKEQRANAEEREREERITERKLKAQEIADWLTEMADDAGLGEIAGTPELAALDKAMETARGYIKHGGGK